MATIFINTDGFATWAGGREFILSIATPVNTLAGKLGLDVVILLPYPSKIQRLKRLLRLFLVWLKLGKDEWNYDINYQDINEEQKDNFHSIGINKFLRIKPKDDLGALNISDMDIVMPCFHENKIKAKKKIHYVADFQHEYFVNHFSEKALIARRQKYATIAKNAECILVNAEKTKRDLLKFTDYGGQVIVLPAAPQRLTSEPDMLAPSYFNLTKKQYLICCNQFWEHKDHMTLLRAFEILKADMPELKLVLTGEIRSTGNSGYANNLLREIENHKNAKDIVVTGLLTKSMQLGMVAQSAVAIQPTLFEGGRGGGFTFECLTMGKPIVLSNIEVNLELAHFRSVKFFDAGQPDSLASCIKLQLKSIAAGGFARSQNLNNELNTSEVKLLKFWEATLSHHFLNDVSSN